MKIKITFILILAILITLLVLQATKKLVGDEQQLVHETTKKAYIPVVIDEHECLLIHGKDTIKLLLENATPLQEEYVIYVVQ